jgi:hypothetical protein
MFKSVGVWVFASTLFVTARAFAETPPAEMASEMLARAQAVDIKCNYLKAADRDTLSKLVARAEIALANRETVEATKATMLRGRESGKTAACSSTENEQVFNILNAAKQATNADDTNPAVAQAVEPAPSMASPEPQQAAILAPEPKPELKQAATIAPAAKPEVAIKTQEPVAPMKPRAIVKIAKFEKPKTKPVQVKSDVSLGKYQAMTAQYFLASRCGSMPATRLGSFYQTIVSSHNQLMATHSNAQVAQALRMGRSNASAQSCS